jgi:4-amino-4-deoxychorismate lyase
MGSNLGPVTDHSTPVVGLLDGTVLDADEPLLRPDDLGVLRGEGVFETTLAVDGEPRDLSEHLVRLAVSAELTGMVVPGPDPWRRAVDAVTQNWTGGRQVVLRLVASRGPESATEPVCYVLGAELSPNSIRQRIDGVRVLLLDRGFTAQAAEAAPWLLAGAKTLSYGVNMAALRHAAANDADDVIFMGSDGAVLEAPTASVVLARGRTLVTPPLHGILDGITVRRLFRVAAEKGWSTETAVLKAGHLHAADGVWLASSARLLAPVTAIDGAERSNGGLTAELGALLDVPA